VTHLLDTSVCVEVLRGNPRVTARLSALRATDVAVSAMTLAELWHGVRKSQRADAMREVVDRFLAPLNVVPFERAAAEAHAASRYALEGKGHPIGERDLIIAATALAHGLTVVTGNLREFTRVPGLRVEEWGRG